MGGILEHEAMGGIFWRRRRQMGEIGAEGATNTGIAGKWEGRKRKGRKEGEFQRRRIQQLLN